MSEHFCLICMRDDCECPEGFSQNERAGQVCGFRPTDVVPIDQPCELGYHCPVCQYDTLTDGNYDERLHWSEYRTFLWCQVCNVDYPSVLCAPTPAEATKIYLDVLEEKAVSTPDPLSDVKLAGAIEDMFIACDVDYDGDHVWRAVEAVKELLA